MCVSHTDTHMLPQKQRRQIRITRAIIISRKKGAARCCAPTSDNLFKFLCVLFDPKQNLPAKFTCSTSRGLCFQVLRCFFITLVLLFWIKLYDERAPVCVRPACNQFLQETGAAIRKLTDAAVNLHLLFFFEKELAVNQFIPF